MLPPLQNSFAVTHSPSKGEISKSSDWPKITELMAALTIRSVVAGYEGKRNASGEMHGVGRLTEKMGHSMKDIFRMVQGAVGASFVFRGETCMSGSGLTTYHTATAPSSIPMAMGPTRDSSVRAFGPGMEYSFTQMVTGTRGSGKAIARTVRGGRRLPAARYWRATGTTASLTAPRSQSPDKRIRMLLCRKGSH